MADRPRPTPIHTDGRRRGTGSRGTRTLALLAQRNFLLTLALWVSLGVGLGVIFLLIITAPRPRPWARRPAAAHGAKSEDGAGTSRKPVAPAPRRRQRLPSRAPSSRRPRRTEGRRRTGFLAPNLCGQGVAPAPPPAAPPSISPPRALPPVARSRPFPPPRPSRAAPHPPAAPPSGDRSRLGRSGSRSGPVRAAPAPTSAGSRDAHLPAAPDCPRSPWPLPPHPLPRLPAPRGRRPAPSDTSAAGGAKDGDNALPPTTNFR